MIKLKEGQEIYDVEGNLYKVEKGDHIKEKFSDSNFVDFTEELDDFMEEKVWSRYDTKILHKSDKELDMVMPIDSNSVDKGFIKEIISLCLNYPSLNIIYDEDSSTLHFQINEDTFYNEHNFNTRTLENQLNDLANNKNKKPLGISYRARGNDYSSMRPMDVGKAIKYFKNNNFDGKSMFYLIENGYVNKLESTTTNGMDKFNRAYFDRLSYEKQEEYMDNLNNTKVESRVILEDSYGSYYVIPNYAMQYIILTYPDIKIGE